MVEKRIKENYRARHGGLELLEEGLQLTLSPAGRRRRARRGGDGRPIPEGYVPLTAEVESWGPYGTHR